MTRRILHSFVVAASLFSASTALAQDVALPEPVAQPTQKSGEGEPEIALDVDREIDLANVVTSAAKGVTTVQEAPAIITIITADEIRARGFKYLMEALNTVPGWLSLTAVGNQVENPAVRGVTQAALLMRDGISLFDPWGNIAWFGRSQPIETIKRIEVVTGPGGVLWGANSFLGIMNLITKDAEDVNGLEVSAGYGDGPGNKQDMKAYALFGKSFFNGKLKIFQHISYETLIGETFDLPQVLAYAPAPQPAGLVYFGKNAPRDPSRSWFAIVDGKYSLGPFSLYYMLPFGEYHPNLVFANSLAQNSTWTTYDRYGVLEYKDRFAKDRVGVTVKGYGVQFVHDYNINLLPASAFFPSSNASDPGGLRFNISGMRVFRVGGTVDFDVNLPFHLRLLAGGELFYEGQLADQATFPNPANADQLPLLCPVDSTGVRVPLCPRTYNEATSRYVGAGYVDAQWRPFEKLTLDGGIRIQKGFGDLAYATVPLGSAAIVYNFLPDFHVKLNYATGFRPPVFNVSAAPAGGVAYGSNPNLKTESSQSFQGELNGRLLRNVRKVREFYVRADYSYTVLNDVIQISRGAYSNYGKRAIQSVEGYGKLYLNGDHFLQASYTYLNATTTDQGVIRNMPNHWFVVGASFNLVKNLLDVNMNLAIFGAYEDPNRVATIVDASASNGASVGTSTARASDLAFDRLTPVADLQLGFRLRFLKDRLQFSGQFYNVLNQRYYYPDNFNDLTPTVEIQPHPAPGFNFFASASYHF
ncbi:MAG: TonB-dependent receptor [Myxococcales bacterium]|nr:TonB-dependent receptor [Myxococcales bacterium]